MLNDVFKHIWKELSAIISVNSYSFSSYSLKIITLFIIQAPQQHDLGISLSRAYM